MKKKRQMVQLTIAELAEAMSIPIPWAIGFIGILVREGHATHVGNRTSKSPGGTKVYEIPRNIQIRIPGELT